MDTFFGFAVVDNFAFAAIIMTLTSEAFACISQHERKIFRQFQNKSCVFDVMPINFRCTVLLVSHSYSGKVIKRLRPTLDEFFDTKTEPGGDFTPKRTTRVKDRWLKFVNKLFLMCV